MYNVFPTTMVIILPFLFLSNPSIILLWVILEMSSIMFICMAISEEETKKKESFLLYFLVQSFASAFLLVMMFSSMAFLSKMTLLENSNNFSIVMSLLICLKIAMAPMHFWLIKMSKFISWFSTATLLTWQKIIPFSFLSTFSMNFLMVSICITSLLIGTLSQLKITSLKMLIVFSSISHLGWMAFPFIKCSMTGLTYLYLYSLIILPMMTLFHFSNYLYLFSQVGYKMLLSVTLLMFSLSGIPPLMGFLLKWMSLYFMISSVALMMMFSLMACMSFYVYTRIIYKSVLLNPFCFHYTPTSVDLKLMWAINLLLPIFCLLW